MTSPAPVSSALTRRIRSSRTSIRSAGELESVKNFYSLSAPTSLSSVHHQLNDWPSWNDWIAQPDMLKKLTQIEDEMDECLMSVDADQVDVATSLRRTFSENVSGKYSGGLDGSDGYRSTVASSKSEQALSCRFRWKQTRNVGGGTRRDTVTSGIQLTDDDDAVDGGVYPDVFPVTAAPVVITSPGSDVDEAEGSYHPTDVPELGTPATGTLGSPGNYVGGLARSTSDVTSQRRFHRRRSAARCMAGLAPASGLYTAASGLYATTSGLYTAIFAASGLYYASASRHGRSCSAIGGDTVHCVAAESGSSDSSPKSETQEQQLVFDRLNVYHG